MNDFEAIFILWQVYWIHGYVAHDDPNKIAKLRAIRTIRNAIEHLARENSLF